MTGESSHARFFREFPGPVVCYDEESGTPIVRAVNSAFEQTFGVEETAIRGDELTDHLLTEAEATASVTKANATDSEATPDALLAELAEGERVTIESRRGDTDSRHFRLEVVPPPDGDGRGYVVYTDITASRRRERDLEARADRLERFIGVAAHDLRNPLDVAKIRLEAARDTGEEVHFEKVATALDRIQHLVREVLSVGGATVEPTEGVSVEAVAEAAWATVDTASGTLALEDDLPTIEADADLLQQMFENLFRNSVEHGATASRSAGDGASDSGASVTVTVGGLPEGFYVDDDGPGIPDDEQERVFEPGYSTTDETTGLGLAIVRQIAEEHGWTVSLTTGDDGGARFTFSGVESDD